jgi:UDP-glucose 4-epimerase
LGAIQIFGDCLKDKLCSAFVDIDIIYHLAVTTIPGRSNDFIQYDALTNLMGSLNFIQATAEADIKRFVFVSSGGSV